MVKNDPINPDHYKGKNGLESIQVIEAFGLNFALGNATKYILRAGKKENKLQDLKKAMWYIEREIMNERNEELEEKIQYKLNKLDGQQNQQVRAYR